MILSLLCWLGSAADHRAQRLVITAFHLPPSPLNCRTKLGVWPDLYIVKIAIGNKPALFNEPGNSMPGHVRFHNETDDYAKARL